MWYAIAAAFVVGMIALNRFLEQRERQGDFDKEGHGSPAHPEPGITYRPLEVPPQPPFD